jgi:hypothetical protein
MGKLYNNRVGKNFILLKSTNMAPNAFTILWSTKDLYGPHKKIGDVKGRKAFVSHEFWNVQIQNIIYSTHFSFSRSSCRLEEPVKDAKMMQIFCHYVKILSQ